MMQRVFLAACSLFMLASCTAQKKTNQSIQQTISSLKLVNIYEIPYNQPFKSTTIGGLSGIDYNPQDSTYFFISDDRSKVNPARFYKAKINISSNGIDTVIFTNFKFLLQEDGTYYPNVTQNPFLTPDPESIRFNKKTNQLVWSSEGERNIKANVLINPSITIIDTTGKFLDEYKMPENLKMSKQNEGPRTNAVFEGLAFDANNKKLYASVEEPLLQDGDEPDTVFKNNLCRILVFDTKTKKNTAQYAYPLDAVAHAPKPTTAVRTTGISEILWLNDKQLLIMERSYSFGIFTNTIKIYIANLRTATDVSNIFSLKENASFKPIQKQLLFNSDDLKMYVDNVEGMTFGPILPNGHKSLIWVVDNNFSSIETAQVFLFDILE